MPARRPRPARATWVRRCDRRGSRGAIWMPRPTSWRDAPASTGSATDRPARATDPALRPRRTRDESEAHRCRPSTSAVAGRRWLPAARLALAPSRQRSPDRACGTTTSTDRCVVARRAPRLCTSEPPKAGGTHSDDPIRPRSHPRRDAGPDRRPSRAIARRRPPTRRFRHVAIRRGPVGDTWRPRRRSRCRQRALHRR